MFNF
jgi:hypothetical protein